MLFDFEVRFNYFNANSSTIKFTWFIEKDYGIQNHTYNNLFNSVCFKIEYERKFVGGKELTFIFHRH